MSYTTDVQIWNNVAFDNGDSEYLTSNRPSWGSLKSTFENPKASFDSVSGKENQGSFLENQIPSVSSSLVSTTTTPFKPINTDGALEKSRSKGVLKKDDEETKFYKRNDGKKIRDDKKIDEEIKEIENEISRLSSRLEALRLEKIEISLRVSEKRGRVVPAKFMDQKQSVYAKNAEEKKKMEEISSTNVKTRIQRRGVSLGPSEIVSGVRRGMSMGPSEIFGSMKPKLLGKQEMITPSQSRRKSCFLKLQEIDEEKVVEKERVKGLNVSPKSRKVTSRNQVLPRQAVTTIASKKGIKKEDGNGIISSIQPKKLFKEGENSVYKKPLKPGRVVASRYNQNNSQASVVRKRSLPENDKDDTKRCEKKRSTSAGRSRVDVDETKNLGTESRVNKKQWEIPSEIVVHRSFEDYEKSPDSMVVVPNLLPRIRIARCMNESPRDSGPAKRVAELTGKNSYFSTTDAEMEPSICQAHCEIFHLLFIHTSDVIATPVMHTNNLNVTTIS